MISMKYLKYLICYVCLFSLSQAKDIPLFTGLLTQGVALTKEERYERKADNYVSFYLKGEGTLTCGELVLTVTKNLARLEKAGVLQAEWRMSSPWGFVGLDFKQGRIYTAGDSDSYTFSFAADGSCDKLVWQIEGILGNIEIGEYYVKNGPRI
jgi:hypothetical protein